MIKKQVYLFEGIVDFLDWITSEHGPSYPIEVENKSQNTELIIHGVNDCINKYNKGFLKYNNRLIVSGALYRI